MAIAQAKGEEKEPEELVDKYPQVEPASGEKTRDKEQEQLRANWREVEPALVAEHDENEVRKDFTPSERVAIAQAIRSRFGERRGRPAQVREEEREPEEIVDKYPQIEPASGEKTRQVVARAAGFGSDFTFRQKGEEKEPEEIRHNCDEFPPAAPGERTEEIPEKYPELKPSRVSHSSSSVSISSSSPSSSAQVRTLAPAGHPR